MNAPKNITPISSDSMKKRLSYMEGKTRNILAELRAGKTSYDICISTGNRKTGALVSSFSTRPVLDCRNCGECRGLCYDLRNDCMYKNVMDSRSRNQALLEYDRDRVFEELTAFTRYQVAFRWHVGGDIQDADYLDRMNRMARKNRNCSYLAFTKSFAMVNEYYNTHRKPKNLQIIFSGWVGLKMDNPHNFPTSHPIFADGSTSAKNVGGAYHCTGNCSECRALGTGCWVAKKGEEIVFNAH